MLMVLLRIVLLMSIIPMVACVIRLAHDLIFEWDKEKDRPMWILSFAIMVVILFSIIGVTFTLVFTLQIT